ncbi:uncharacterized protein LOC114755431 [Neltuma alba]|uniref:uncharacterized protein LOC114749556 n=1 Tax=Neltuma alba TaxID=207710 RepID=UPI0010A42F52|nr:uncharacterized protein LOC114749556 [Prosopis alba]XP_028800142.1 uncharacterized protein LOC114755431 [Prosopis alba]
MELANQKSKRLRHDSEPHSPESKIARVDSPSDVNPEDPAMDSSVATDIHDDLLDILDETDNLPERDPTMQGLDSVIKSFEEEILASGPGSVIPDPTPESGEFPVQLGYLLEASDDELGLPPSVTPSEDTKPESEELSQVGSDGVDMGELLGFENDIEKYESVGLGDGENENGGGIVSFDDGLLDYPDLYEVVWRSESLQAM